MTSPSTRSRSRTKKAVATPPTPPPAEDLAEPLVPSSPLFRQPQPADPPSYHEGTTTEATTVEVPWLSQDDSDPSAAGFADASPSGTPSTDNPPQKTPKLGRAALRKWGKKVVMVAGVAVHSALTRPETIQRAGGLWLPDEEDLHDIADPIAGLTLRRLPAGMGKASPDLEDLIDLAIALGNYLMKQLEKHAELAAGEPEFIDMTADASMPDPAVA